MTSIRVPPSLRISPPPLPSPVAVISSHVAPGDEIDSGDTPRLPPPSARGNGQEEWRLEASDEGPRFCWPAWVTTTLEIVGVVAAWTGVEW